MTALGFLLPIGASLRTRCDGRRHAALRLEACFILETLLIRLLRGNVFLADRCILVIHLPPFPAEASTLLNR